jgi:hypothetical protein
MLAGDGGAMYGQQSLMPLIKAVIWGFGGGQLIEAALGVLVRAAARGQAAAGTAASATATAASTIVPASLAGGREAGGGIPVPLRFPGFHHRLPFAAGSCGPVHAVHAGGRSAAGAAAA